MPYNNKASFRIVLMRHNQKSLLFLRTCFIIEMITLFMLYPFLEDNGWIFSFESVTALCILFMNCLETI